MGKPRSFAIAAHLDRAALERLAGRDAFARAEQCVARGGVLAVGERAGTIVAKVQGGTLHEVHLSHADTGLEHACTCLVAKDGSLCEHGVAVALAILDGTTSPTPAPPPPDARAYLERLPKSDLVKLLVELSHQDVGLRDRLAVKAAMDPARRNLDIPAIKRAIDAAVRVDGYIDWRCAGSYAEGVETVVDSLAALIDEGHGEPIIDLIEHAIAGVDQGLANVQDDGELGPSLERLQEMHLAVCVATRPEPVALARRLLTQELESGFGMFDGADERYADVLGEAGLAEYRLRAGEVWRKLPALGPGWHDAPGTRRFPIARVIERLARQTGNVEDLVAVLVRDLSEPHRYLRIAEAYRKAGDDAKALRWAEKGVAAFPKACDRRLVELAAELRARAGSASPGRSAESTRETRASRG